MNETFVGQVDFLLKEVGIKSEDVAKVLSACPPLISMSISAKLRPNLLFLRSIPLRPDKIAAVVVAYPQACSRHTRYTLGHAAGGGGLLMLGAFRCAALQDCEATGAWI